MKDEESSASWLGWVVMVLVAGAVAGANAQGEWESLFLDSVSAADARAFSQNYTATAHLAGTPEDHQTALNMQAQVH